MTNTSLTSIMATSQPSSSSSTGSTTHGDTYTKGLWDFLQKHEDQKAASHLARAIPQPPVSLLNRANTTAAASSSSLSPSSSPDKTSPSALNAKALQDFLQKHDDKKAASHPAQAFLQPSIRLRLDASTTTAFSSPPPSSSDHAYMAPYSLPVRNNWNGGSSAASTAVAPSVFDSGASEITCLTTPSEAPGLYLCEFLGLAGCMVSYNPGEEIAWINHIAAWHMNRNFPRKSVCWYCDEVEFDSNADDMNVRGDYFSQRMEHISQHLRDGWGLQRRIRPDYALVKHLCDAGICDQSLWERAMEFDENPYPLPGDMQNCGPATAPTRQPRRVPVSSYNVGQTSRPGRSSRPRREKLYHS